MRRAPLFACATIATAMLAISCSIIRAPSTTGAPTGTLQGVVTGPSGPVQNAEVDVTAADATQHGGLSNADGFYSIASIPAGPATYSVQAPGFAPYNGAVTINPDPNSNRQDVSLNPQ